MWSKHWQDTKFLPSLQVEWKKFVYSLLLKPNNAHRQEPVDMWVLHQLNLLGFRKIWLRFPHLASYLVMLTSGKREVPRYVYHIHCVSQINCEATCEGLWCSSIHCLIGIQLSTPLPHGHKCIYREWIQSHTGTGVNKQEQLVLGCCQLTRKQFNVVQPSKTKKIILQLRLAIPVL